MSRMHRFAAVVMAVLHVMLIGCSSPTGLEVSKDGATIRDAKTGLMWAQNANLAGRKMKWDEAQAWVGGINIGGFKDWRLPAKEELEIMAKDGGKSPAEWFNANGFQNVQSNVYWSSTTYAGNTYSAWSIGMDFGYVYLDVKGINHYVWPVRSDKVFDPAGLKNVTRHD